MNRLSNKKGFTLIELIVVIAILGIIATIAVPRMVGIVERAKLSADRATVKTLNKVTPIFRILNSSDNSFTDGTDDTELIGVLVDNRYLNSVVEPQSEDATFTWKIEDEQWYLNFSDSNYTLELGEYLAFTSDHGMVGTWDGAVAYTGTSKDIIIPAELDGTVISKIYRNAFKNTDLIAVEFVEASQITQIHDSAFRDNNLASIVFPDSLTKIDGSSFKNNALTEIELPPNLTRIEWEAFKGNDELNKITVRADDDGNAFNVDIINNSAFGSKTEAFKTAYEAGGAGTYIYNTTTGTWTK